jgi:hypothetical protein
MAKAGLHKIKAIRSWYIFYRLGADVFFAAAIAVAVEGVLFYVCSYPVLCALPVFALSLALLLYSRRAWSVNYADISAFLDRTYPALEESSSLALKPAGELYLLERLQLQRVEENLRQVPVQHREFFKRLLFAIMCFMAAIAVNFIVGKGKLFHYAGQATGDNVLPVIKNNSAPEKILPQIASINVHVLPPAYTGKAGREQDKFNLAVEDGSTVEWNIKTNISIKQVSLLFNDTERLNLRSNTDRTAWAIQKNISRPGFYQVIIDGKASELYQVIVIKDSPPVIQIKKPGQYTYIDAGEAQQVNIDATVNDDYGISNVMIIATVAKGSGEAVKFKEFKIAFSAAFNEHRPQYNLQKLVNLPALAMEPGDELYFYIQATDTRRQQTRTDAYTVAIQDTAQLLSMDGILTGANIKPEFFRSERQIIMDTERLLREKDTIKKESFNSRSNDLGIDQKLLRLRYGKFLGEEEESAIGADAASGTELSKIDNFNNAAMVKDAYTDKHDNAEVAGFLEPAIKEQLKATLTEMWKAELQLRLNKPETALAFEYKALRLLKDLQQKSRSYVAKTAYNPTPLKMEKRLSGDLSKIIQPLSRRDIKPETDNAAALKQAVEVLEQLKLNPHLSGADSRLLQLANQQLSVSASAEPAVYLPALNAMRRILSSKIKMSDIGMVERAIQRSLIQPGITPQASPGAADMGLSSSYYKNLQHANGN